MLQRLFRDESEANRPKRRVTAHGGHLRDSEPCSTKKSYERSMAEADDEISCSEPALSGAMARIRRLGGFRANWRVPSLLFSSLLFSSLIGSRPGTNGVGMGFYYLPLVVEFPVRRIHRKVTLERYRSVAGFMRPYEGVRVWIFFPSLLMYGIAAQGVCS
jgi:hypothetical protein